MPSRDRTPYESATVLDQDLLDEMQDNLRNGLRSIIEVTAPDDSIIRVSDRNTYVGEHFYEARTNFPAITRNVGDWLGGSLVFSEIEFVISNADGFYNNLLPAGDDFSDWKGRPVELKIGLGEIESTYISVFKGTISNEGGFSRDVTSFKIRARNDLEKVNVSFPNTVFTNLSHPKGNDELWGSTVPLVYGDWTVEVTGGGASLPALVTNGADIYVNGESIPVEISVGSPAIFTSARHRLDVNNKIELETDGTLPTGLSPGEYFVKQVVSVDTFTVSATAGGAAINTTGAGSGSHTVRKPDAESFGNVQLTISENDLESFTTSEVYLIRSDLFFKIPASLVTSVGAENKTFEIIQNSASFQIDGQNWTYTNSDEFYVKAKGKEIDGSYNNNPVWIARDILKTYGGLIDSDFNSSWATFRDKPSVSSTKARAYIREPQNTMEYTVSLMEQVALEPFVNRDLKFSINSLQFDDWDASADFRVKNWDVERNTFKPTIDQRNNFNRARGIYNFLPNLGENAWSTNYYRNQAAIDQQGISETKALIYPNLYQEDRVEYFLTETLKLTSAFREVGNFTATPRAFLLDIGEFIKIDVQIGSSIFDDVPFMIRNISYDPATLKISMSGWIMSMVPFPGYEPNYAGTVGGYNATITEE